MSIININIVNEYTRNNTDTILKLKQPMSRYFSQIET